MYGDHGEAGLVVPKLVTLVTNTAGVDVNQIKQFVMDMEQKLNPAFSVIAVSFQRGGSGFVANFKGFVLHLLQKVHFFPACASIIAINQNDF